MNDIKKDIFVGLMFIFGIWSFISGEFIVSAVIFAVAALYTNIFTRTSALKG